MVIATEEDPERTPQMRDQGMIAAREKAADRHEKITQQSVGTMTKDSVTSLSA